MKKFIKIGAILVAISMVVLSTTSCSKIIEELIKDLTEEDTGHYSGSGSGTTYDLDDGTYYNSSKTKSIVLNGNYYGVANSNGDSDSGTWSKYGNSLTFYSSSGNDFYGSVTSDNEIYISSGDFYGTYTKSSYSYY